MMIKKMNLQFSFLLLIFELLIGKYCLFDKLEIFILSSSLDFIINILLYIFFHELFLMNNIKNISFVMNFKIAYK